MVLQLREVRLTLLKLSLKRLGSFLRLSSLTSKSRTLGLTLFGPALCTFGFLLRLLYSVLFVFILIFGLARMVEIGLLIQFGALVPGVLFVTLGFTQCLIEDFLSLRFRGYSSLGGPRTPCGVPGVFITGEECLCIRNHGVVV